MVTNITPKFNKGQYAGTSADQKPMDVQNGSVYHEIDTGKYYMFDAEGKQWYVQEDNGGGGGGGTFDHTKLANRDKPKQHPIKAIDGLQEALDEKANKADVYSKAEANQNFANALVRTVQGEVITVDDVSPLEHEVKCTVSGVPDLSKVTVSRFGGNLATKIYEGIVNEDGEQTTYRKEYYSTIKEKLPAGIFTLSADVPLSIVRVKLNGVYETNPHYPEQKSIQFTHNGGEMWISYRKKDDTPIGYLLAMFNYGPTALPYQPFVSSEPYMPSPDGTVSGMKSLSPNMTILTDTPGALLDVTYNADVNKVLEKKDAEIASLTDRIKVLEDKATNLPTV